GGENGSERLEQTEKWQRLGDEKGALYGGGSVYSSGT
ncbi:hypothetical protein A2U01_0093807, partial [Trifolium medium]|nr:hypothetical protein [Trifolium medium]